MTKNKAIIFSLISIIGVCTTIYILNKNNKIFYKNLTAKINDTLSYYPTFTIINNNDNDVFLTFNYNNSFIDFNIESNPIKDTNKFVKEIFNNLTTQLSNLNFLNSKNIPATTRYYSIGFGLCDKLSEIFCYIVAKKGIKSRLLDLNGHVVCELYYDNQWHLFDVERKTYFLKDSIVLSYEQIIQNRNHLEGLSANKNFQYLTVINHYKQFFSASNNITIYKFNPENNDNFLLQLPPKSTIEFPVFDYSIDLFIPYNIFLKLNINNKGKYRIKNPFFIAKIIGSGNIKYLNKTYSLPKDTFVFSFDILMNSEYSEEITVDVMDSICIYYRLNPLLFKNRKLTELDIYFNLPIETKISINKLSIMPITLADNVKFNQQKLKYIVKKIPYTTDKSIRTLYETIFDFSSVDTTKIEKRIQLLEKLPYFSTIYYDPNAYYIIWYFLLFSEESEFMQLYRFYYRFFYIQNLLNEMKNNKRYQS